MTSRGVAAVVILVAACGADNAPPGVDRSTAIAPELASKAAPREPAPPQEMAEEPVGCRSAFRRGALAVRESPTVAAGSECSPPEKHEGGPYFMDLCEPAGWTAGCAPELGSQFCMNRQWTTACRDDSQCPKGTRCTDGATAGAIDLEYSDYGWCAPSCNPRLGASACERCDLECEPDLHVCIVIDKPSPGSIVRHKLDIESVPRKRRPIKRATAPAMVRLRPGVATAAE